MNDFASDYMTAMYEATDILVNGIKQLFKKRTRK